MQKSLLSGKTLSFQNSQGMSILVYETSQAVCSLAMRGSDNTKSASLQLSSLPANGMAHQSSALRAAPDHTHTHVHNEGTCQGTY